MGFRNPVTTVDVATLAGPVTIGSMPGLTIVDPVNVQGGGELLFGPQVVTLDDEIAGLAWWKQVLIYGPPNGMTYYGLRITLDLLTTGERVTWTLPSARGTLYNPSPGATVYKFAPGVHRFVVPMTQAFPVALELLAAHASGGSVQVLVTVEGISVATVGPATDNTFPYYASAPTSGSFQMAAGAVGTLWLAPSFQPYEVLVAPLTGGTVTATSMTVVRDEQGDASVFSNPHMSPNYVASGATLTGPNAARVPVRGDGRVHALAVAVAGAICRVVPLL